MKISIESLYSFFILNLKQIIYCVCVILLIIGSFFAIQHYKKVKYENKLNEYYQAVYYHNIGDIDTALTMLNKLYLSTTDPNLKSIIGLQYANILLNNKKHENVKNIYNDIFALKNNDLFLRNLSGLFLLNYLINQDELNQAEIEQLIKKMSNPTNPLLMLILEQEGIFKLRLNKKTDSANTFKDLLKSFNLDDITKSRIDSLIGLTNNN